MKAFFSHSYHDVDLVREVAKDVGRQFVAIDATEFQVADDLILAMERAIRESAVFVFFASQQSMASAWVNFEINEARYHQALTRIKRVVVVILDNNIDISELPAWMRRAKMVRHWSARPIARFIRHQLDELIAEHHHRFFVGRAKELAELQAVLVPLDTNNFVSVMAIYGLPGIGRRTLLMRAAKDNSSFVHMLVIRVETGDTTHSLAIKLADLVAPTATAQDSFDGANNIAFLDQGSAQAQFIKDVEQANRFNDLVVLYDEGGLLNRAGSPTPAILGILEELLHNRDLAVALVTNRRPMFREIEALEAIPIINVAPLQPSESKQLLALTARARHQIIPAPHLNQLAGRLRGYPPAAAAVVEEFRVYGPGFSNVGGSPPFQARPLSRYLRNLSLSPTEKYLLRLLANNSPLPLQVLANLGADIDDAWAAIKALIDASLVLPDDAGRSWYHISEPIVDYVEREYGPCSVADFEHVAAHLGAFVNSDASGEAYLELLRVLYRALQHAGGGFHRLAYELISDRLRLAAEFYHQRDYARALEHARAVDDAARSTDSLPWLVRCLVRNGENDKAFEAIEALRSLGDVAEAHFLRGFLEQQRGKHFAAIKHYELASKAGRGGLAIQRDLADCFLHIGDYTSATTHILAAQDKQPDNPFVVNLRIRIACAERDEKTARDLLPLLEEVDKPAFADHRRARVELTFGNKEAAYAAALRATDGMPRPPFEIVANLALCQILTGNDYEATLQRLKVEYRGQKPDAQTVLRIRAAIAAENFADALGEWQTLEQKSSLTHQALHRDALRGALGQKYYPPNKLQELTTEIARLDALLPEKSSAAEWHIDPD